MDLCCRLQREVAEHNQETKNELAKLASQIEGHCKLEMASLREKAAQLEKENANARAELQKLRLEMICTNNDVREDVVRTAKSFTAQRPQPTSWWEGIPREHPEGLEKQVWGWGKNPEDVREMMANLHCPAARLDTSDRGAAGRTPHRIPSENLETVWLYPDGKVVPEGSAPVPVRIWSGQNQRENVAKMVGLMPCNVHRTEAAVYPSLKMFQH